MSPLIRVTLGKWPWSFLIQTPGPGTYKVTEPSTYKNKQPQYSMTARNELPSDSTRKPGPGAYRPEQVSYLFFISNLTKYLGLCNKENFTKIFIWYQALRILWSSNRRRAKRIDCKLFYNHILYFHKNKSQNNIVNYFLAIQSVVQSSAMDWKHTVFYSDQYLNRFLRPMVVWTEFHDLKEFLALTANFPVCNLLPEWQAASVDMLRRFYQVE